MIDGNIYYAKSLRISIINWYTLRQAPFPATTTTTHMWSYILTSSHMHSLLPVCTLLCAMCTGDLATTHAQTGGMFWPSICRLSHTLSC